MNTEYLRLSKDSLEIMGYADKEALFKHFYTFINRARSYKNFKLEWQREEGIEQQQYSYGSFTNLFTDKFNQGAFVGVSQNTHQLFISLIMESPKLGKEIKTNEWERLEGCKIDYGMLPEDSDRWVTTEEKWQEKRIDFYHCNPNLIYQEHHQFLHNKEWSDQILRLICYEHKLVVKCSEEFAFHDEFLKNLHCNEREAKISEFGDKICKANFFVEDRKLSQSEAKQTGSRRRVYKSCYNPTQYLSLDFAHGMLELHDQHGRHLGEYRFGGTPNKPADPSHNLKTL